MHYNWQNKRNLKLFANSSDIVGHEGLDWLKDILYQRKALLNWSSYKISARRTKAIDEGNIVKAFDSFEQAIEYYKVREDL